MNFRKQFLLIFATSTITLGIFFGLQYIFAWTNPTLNPPSGNVSPAINEGSTAQVKDGSLGVSGNLTAPIFYDSSNTGYYIDPASVSRLNDIRPNIIYDGQNTNYYVDPAGTSKFNTVNLGGESRSSWPSAIGIGYTVPSSTTYTPTDCGFSNCGSFSIPPTGVTIYSSKIMVIYSRIIGYDVCCSGYTKFCTVSRYWDGSWATNFISTDCHTEQPY